MKKCEGMRENVVDNICNDELVEDVQEISKEMKRLNRKT